MDKLKDLLGRKVYGIPVAAIFALAMGVFLFYAIKMKPAVEEEVTDAGATDDGGDVAEETVSVFAAKPVVMTQVSNGNSAVAIPQEDTNELWGKRALESLLAAGVSYDLASGTVSKYLAGEELTAEQGKVRDRAVSALGLPPDGVSYASTAVPAGPVAKPAAPTVATQTYNGPASRQGVPPLTHTVKGKSDDTYAELSQLYYRHNTANSRRTIKVANPGLDEPPFRVGAKVKIPKESTPKYYRATSATKSATQIAAKNGTDAASLRVLNPSLKFPVKVGTRVRVA